MTHTDKPTTPPLAGRLDKHIAADVENGLRIHAMISGLNTMLEGIEERLKEDALQRPELHEPLVESEREGRRCILPGGLGIVFTADKLKKEMDSATGAVFLLRSLVLDTLKKDEARFGSEDEAAAAELAGAVDAVMQELTTPWSGVLRAISDGLDFRTRVRQLLGDDDAAEKFVEAWKVKKDGLPVSDTKAEWADLAKAKSEERLRAQMDKLQKETAKAEKKAAKAEKGAAK